MGRGRLRNWWPRAAVTAIAVVVAWLLYLLFRSRSRDDLSTYGAFALPVAILVCGWFGWAWRKGKTSPSADTPGNDALGQAADQLAAAVQAQWKKAAEERGLTGADPVRVTWGRPSQPLAGPVAAATASYRFSPVAGLEATGETDLASGNASDLHALYGGLRSGRLIIAGPPGSGKSGAAVLLLLAALRYREQTPAEQRPNVPVPVLFTAQDWDPAREQAMHWLTRKLQVTYPLFDSAVGATTAAALLASGRITVILDGLDEISPDLRPVALQALSQQATFRLVILSRTVEMAEAAEREGVLRGAAAIELNLVSPADAASYLERTQLDPPTHGWQELIARIRAYPGSPLSRALGSPLALTLVRDTYQTRDSIRELLEFCDSDLKGVPASQATEAIAGHLLDRVLPAAYAPIPGQEPPPYDLATAQRLLTIIADRMNRDGTRDLNWWQIPRWAPRIPRIAIAGVLGGLMVGLAVAPGVWLGFGLRDGLVAGLVAGLVCGLGCGSLGVGDGQPSAFRFTKALGKGTLTSVLVVGLAAGILAGVPGRTGVAGGLVVGLMAGLAVAFLAAVEGDPKSNSSVQPITSWRSDRRCWLGAGLVGGLLIGLEVGSVIGLEVGLEEGLVGGLVAGLVGGFAVGPLSGQSWAVTLASVQLAAKRGTPWQMMRFLNDAHTRNVLRAVGPSYQFRHARLQDRLAAAAATTDGSAQTGLARPSLLGDRQDLSRE